MPKIATLSHKFQIRVIDSQEAKRELVSEFMRRVKYSQIEYFNSMLRTIWEQTAEREARREKLARVLALGAVFDSTLRVKAGAERLWSAFYSLSRDQRFIEALRGAGESIDAYALEQVQSTIGPLAGVATSTHIKHFTDFLSTSDVDRNIAKWLSRFDCPIKCYRYLRESKLPFAESNKIGAMFIKYVGHRGVLPLPVEPVVDSWYPGHKRCFPILVDGHVVTFAMRTGLINPEDIVQYPPVKSVEELWVFSSWGSVPSAVAYNGLVFDVLKQVSDDPALLDDYIFHFGKTICVTHPRCSQCQISDLCANSRTTGGKPESIAGFPAPPQRIRTQPKNLECMKDMD